MGTVDAIDTIVELCQKSGRDLAAYETSASDSARRSSCQIESAFLTVKV